MEHAPFVHLHTHSEYSILDGSAKIDDLVRKAVHFRMPALALTDHGNMFGALEFYKSAMHHGIKPIIGEEFYVAPSSMHRRIAREKPYHLILLATNELGYRNLVKLSSHAFLEGFYYKPRIDKDLLASHTDGLICMSSCMGGEIPVHILQGKPDEARKAAGQYLDMFSRDHFYFELMNNGMTEQETVNRELVKLSSEMGVGLVATNDVHYLEKADAAYHDVLLCIQTGKTINETQRFRFKSEEFYFKSSEEMFKLFGHVPEAIRNTIEITEKCNLLLELGQYRLPHFPIPDGYTAETYLTKLSMEGIGTRYGEITQEVTEEVKQRVQMELQVIESMGFSTYFLIVWDFIRFARSRGIAVGPGRGSAAGSIVAYALGITDVDPLRYGLIFERFLNVSRISMPDIDIDFDGDRRDEVIKYVREKYGQDRVAQIITFGAMKARAAVRDVARAMDMTPQEADVIAKLIPPRIDITIDDAIATSKELKDRVEQDEQIKQLFDYARGLEKLVRHPSTHAAGVVISPVALTEIVPLYRDPKSGVISTQYQMKNLEDVGLIKMDFLGLKNLTIIQRCLRDMEHDGLPVPNMESLDLTDAEVYELLARGRSMGVFQLESSGMQNLLKRLQPSRFDDVIAILALYRPGPLDSGMVDEFIERKGGRKPIVYADKRLEPVLRETYGVIVYQEQVMEIAQVICGYSMAEADNLRKAMGKKKPEILEEEREKFIEGAVTHGVDRKVSEEVFELIRTFGRYGFNKSHSTAYALLAFQTAYLKVHFPVYYLASLLSGELQDTDKICQYICESREVGIEVEPPDINRSEVLFSVEGMKILYALAAVKNVGAAAVQGIVDERRQNGRYNSLHDFTSRVDLRLVNRRVIESLVKAGAMDSLGETRRTLFENIDGALEFGASVQGDRLKGQWSLFEEMDGEGETPYYQMRQFDEWSETELSEFEKEVLGFYFKAHPLLKYDGVIKRLGAVTIGELKEIPSDSRVSLLGILSSVKVITTRDNKEMAFAGLEDLSGTLEIVVFPSVYEKFSGYLGERRVIVVTGRINGDKVMADRLLYPEEAEKEAHSGMHVLLPRSVDEEKLMRLRDLFIQNRGRCTIFIHTPELDSVHRAIRASTFLLVDPNESLLEQLRDENLVEKAWVT
jgi:DNA polymerase-3 subunit alpha